MNNKKTKGFTLVELIAVIVILITVMLIALTVTNKQMEKARENAFLADANAYIKGAQEKYTSDRSTGKIKEDLFHNTIPGKVCYSIEDQLNTTYVEKDVTAYTGSVEVCFGADCDYHYKIWITDGERFIEGLSNVSKRSDIKTKFTTSYPKTCGVEALGTSGTSGDLTTAEFDFTASEYVMTIAKDGVYSLEAWGAQGGEASFYHGGYGGYAYTEVELHVDDKLYINVGGKGNPAGSPAPKGGYNGGGEGYASNGSGGGSTTITAKSGFISKPINRDYIYLVAGGGGGAKSYGTDCCYDPIRNGYNGGGFKDESGSVTQSGNVYGTATSSGGNGGGYFASNHYHRDPGYGGSGYIGNPLTKNGVMYGFNVEESNASTTHTINTSEVSEKPIAGYAKQGNGYAIIKYIGDYTS